MESHHHIHPNSTVHTHPLCLCTILVRHCLTPTESKIEWNFVNTSSLAFEFLLLFAMPQSRTMNFLLILPRIERKREREMLCVEPCFHRKIYYHHKTRRNSIIFFRSRFAFHPLDAPCFVCHSASVSRFMCVCCENSM